MRSAAVRLHRMGKIAVSSRRFELLCESAKMALKALCLGPVSSPWKPNVNGSAIAVQVRDRDGPAVIGFAEPLRFAASAAITA